ncbi:hypothetical protein PPL_12612 [Heterostelium album PN500]|uniref:FNIP repeat-containing protein n=1 Tax=Heterostelium pallidum (strain ATCC 26659 / Pp 5 / PN500) TaxID=670386 RepID=D3BN35_HETP5|nr:hypothetical protein PPL_12612 [Heterostelium album PN500]EFA77397.1 hypothetical protein PPL_12612 [Heterostelium album PN500]|eukprot:XP_020429526.1 hypothetical protein PPL_12612 [Heterostelium album PN500]
MKKPKSIYLNSYQTLIIDANKQKKQCTAIVFYHRYKCDYVLHPNNILETNNLQSNIYKITISEQIAKDILKDEKFEHLLQLIPESNVIKLKRCPTLEHRLPGNLTSLSFSSEFDEPLLKGYLPPNLITLKLGAAFNQPIEEDTLPNTLKTLIFGEGFDYPIEPGVLPESLEVLKMINRDYELGFQVGSLPPNLRVLTYSGSCEEIGLGVLPPSLDTLKNVPSGWISEINTLPNLKSLSLFKHRFQEPIVVSDLPASLTSLKVDYSTQLTSAMPSSIKNLNICTAEYDVDEIFNDRSQYHLETLTVDGNKLESLEKLDIKHMYLSSFKTKGRNKMRDIPLGVETLRFSNNLVPIVDPNSIPITVKKIIFENNYTMATTGYIPNFVDELVVKSISKTRFPNKIVPDSIRTITTTSMDDTIKSSNICVMPDKYHKILIRKIGKQYLVLGQSNNNFKAAIINKIEQVTKFLQK